MAIFGRGKSLRDVFSERVAARRRRLMERVLRDLPEHLGADMGVQPTRSYFIPRMLGE